MEKPIQNCTDTNFASNTRQLKCYNRLSPTNDYKYDINCTMKFIMVLASRL